MPCYIHICVIKLIYTNNSSNNNTCCYFIITGGALEYQAQSPDEGALVNAARNFGFVFKVDSFLTYFTLIDSAYSGEPEVGEAQQVSK